MLQQLRLRLIRYVDLKQLCVLVCDCIMCSACMPGMLCAHIGVYLYAYTSCIHVLCSVKL